MSDEEHLHTYVRQSLRCATCGAHALDVIRSLYSEARAERDDARRQNAELREIAGMHEPGAGCRALRDRAREAEQLVKEVREDFSLAMPFASGEHGSEARWSWHERAKHVLPPQEDADVTSDHCPTCGSSQLSMDRSPHAQGGSSDQWPRAGATFVCPDAWHEATVPTQ